MFVVYSPEGQNVIAAAELKPQLRVDPSKRVPAVGESQLDETRLLTEDKQEAAPNRSAINQYRSVQTSDHGQPVIHVSEVMSSPVITISSETSLQKGWEILNAQKIHHLPVLDEQSRLVGIVTSTEILQRVIVGSGGELEETRADKVAEVMRKEVITTYPTTDIRRVALVMTVYQIGSVVILDQEGSVQGIVTLSDLVKRLSEEPPLTLYA